jgi:type IV secretory pathway VirJ component
MRLCLAGAFLLAAFGAQATEDSLSFGAFGKVRLYYESTRSANVVLFISGDGGWGEPEKGISRDLAKSGASVVGWNSLHYYWKKRSPDGAAADLERIARHYMASWHKKRLVLVGYSSGADVLPFLVNRLPEDVRSAVSTIVLMGLSPYTDFEFYLTNRLGRTSSSAECRVKPELEKLRGMNVKIFCFCSEEDSGVI